MHVITRTLSGVLAAVMFGGGCAAQAAEPLRFTPGPEAPTPAAAAPSNVDGAAYLARLRETYRLDEVVAGATSDLERVRKMSRWVRSRWEHNGSNEPKQSDPLSILAEAQTGQKFRCVEYAEVLAAALSAVGVPSRVLALKTRDVETRKSGAGHVVAEAYLRDRGKWALVDGQWDVIPIRAGTPLNAVELQRAIAEKARDLSVESLSGTSTRKYVGWVSEYLYYFDTTPRAWTTGAPSGTAKLMLVPADAPTPTVFQIRFPLAGYAVTHSAETFYAPPPTARL